MPSIGCRACLTIPGGHQIIDIDVRIAPAGEVWLSIAEIVGGTVTRESAVWRSFGWTPIMGGRSFDPSAVLRRACKARPWDKEPPEEMAGSVHAVIAIAAGLRG